MRMKFRSLIGRLIVMFAALGMTHVAHAQQPDGQAPGDAELTHTELSKKELSEFYNQTTYSDDQWDGFESALAANLKACDAGDAAACVGAGDAFWTGEGVWAVGEVAQILYKQACDGGFARGCGALGRSLIYPDDLGEEDLDTGMALLDKGCVLGDLEACHDWATELHRDATAQEDIARAQSVFETACESGWQASCLWLAGHYGASPRWSLDPVTGLAHRSADYEKSLAILDKACADSSRDACETAANWLQFEEQPEEARIAEYRHAACALDSADACWDMGQRRYRGVGLQSDRDLAFGYYDNACRIESYYCEKVAALRNLPALRMACDRDDAQACADLALSLADIRSPEYDLPQSFSLAQFSCDRGIGPACRQAADLLGRRNDAQVVALPSIATLLEKGCAVDDLESCYALAQRLEKGDDAASDIPRAVTLYRQLCDREFAQSCYDEGKYAGIVPEARIVPADASYLPPLDEGEADSEPDHTAWFFRRFCPTRSVEFRGIVYTSQNCAKIERGINPERSYPGEAPWQALIWRPKRMNGTVMSEESRVACGGSLIAMGWVLTAAHCLNDKGNLIATSGHTIRLGVFNPVREEGVSYRIKRVIAHPLYTPSKRYAFDVALVEYDAPSPNVSGRTETIRSITTDPLPVGQRTITNGMPVVAFGWGVTEVNNGRNTDYMQRIKMQLTAESTCTAKTGFSGKFLDAALCAGGEARQQTCFGDSGGPLVYYETGKRPVLIGVVSAGKECGTNRDFGNLSQYTRVGKIRDWIKSYVTAIR